MFGIYMAFLIITFLGASLRDDLHSNRIISIPIALAYAIAWPIVIPYWAWTLFGKDRD